MLRFYDENPFFPASLLSTLRCNYPEMQSFLPWCFLLSLSGNPVNWVRFSYIEHLTFLTVPFSFSFSPFLSSFCFTFWNFPTLSFNTFIVFSCCYIFLVAKSLFLLNTSFLLWQSLFLSCIIYLSEAFFCSLHSLHFLWDLFCLFWSLSFMKQQCFSSLY